MYGIDVMYGIDFFLAGYRPALRRWSPFPFYNCCSAQRTYCLCIIGSAKVAHQHCSETSNANLMSAAGINRCDTLIKIY